MSTMGHWQSGTAGSGDESDCDLNGPWARGWGGPGGELVTVRACVLSELTTLQCMTRIP